MNAKFIQGKIIQKVRQSLKIYFSDIIHIHLKFHRDFSKGLGVMELNNLYTDGWNDGQTFEQCYDMIRSFFQIGRQTLRMREQLLYLCEHPFYRINIAIKFRHLPRYSAPKNSLKINRREIPPK